MDKIKIPVITCIILAILLGIELFAHSTPERSVRSYLFFHGYPMQSLKTTVFLSRIDEQYGRQYSCKDPSVGCDFFTTKKSLGLYWVDLETSGGG